MSLRCRSAFALLFALIPCVAFAAPTQVFNGSQTSVRLSSTFTAAATALSLRVEVLSPGFISGRNAAFPVSSAPLDFQNAKGEISHIGGLRIRSATVRVDLRNFVITTLGTAPVLTGVVIANGTVVGRITLFAVALPAISLPIASTTRTLKISPAALTLTSEAAAALNGAFGVTAFTAGLDIGAATVRLSGGRRL